MILVPGEESELGSPRPGVIYFLPLLIRGLLCKARLRAVTVAQLTSRDGQMTAWPITKHEVYKPLPQRQMVS